jgi:hypothetical protein
MSPCTSINSKRIKDLNIGTIEHIFNRKNLWVLVISCVIINNDWETVKKMKLKGTIKRTEK